MLYYKSITPPQTKDEEADSIQKKNDETFQGSIEYIFF